MTKQASRCCDRSTRFCPLLTISKNRGYETRVSCVLGFKVCKEAYTWTEKWSGETMDGPYKRSRIVHEYRVIRPSDCKKNWKLRLHSFNVEKAIKKN